MNLTARTAAAALAAAAALVAGVASAAPAGAAPADGPAPYSTTISADSPAYLTNVTYGGATVNDADGIKLVTQYIGDKWHGSSTGPGNCAKSFNVVQQYNALSEFTVTDCKGFKKTFHFKVVG
jgi:hypothetical protein